jgi:hypothetical protein
MLEMLHADWMKLPFVLGLTLVGAGCAAQSHAAAPAGVPVQALIADRLTLRGTASPTLTNPSCDTSTSLQPSHVFEMPEESQAMIRLTPSLGEGPLPTAMMHVTNLDTNKTWCVMTKPDGTPATIAGDLPSGMYSVSVAEIVGAPPRRYEVKVEKL